MELPVVLLTADHSTNARRISLALSSHRKFPAHPIESPYYYYCLSIPSICRNLVFSIVSAGPLQPLFSQFSKS